MAINLSAQHLAQMGGFYEPQRANNGVLYVDGLTGWDSDASPVALAIESFPLPKESNVKIEARWQNERRKFAGPADVEDMEVVVKDMVDIGVAAVLKGWRREVYNPGDPGRGFPASTLQRGAIGLAKIYKKNAVAVITSPDGGWTRRFKLTGVWPTAMDPGDIDMTSEDFVKISLTLSVDIIEEVVLTSPPPLATGFGAVALA